MMLLVCLAGPNRVHQGLAHQPHPDPPPPIGFLHLGQWPKIDVWMMKSLLLPKRSTLGRITNLSPLKIPNYGPESNVD